MSDKGIAIQRVLVAHADDDTRTSMAQAVRTLESGAVSVYEAISLTDAMEKARQFDPHLVLVDLYESRDLALDLVRALRRADRLILGVYNPILVGPSETGLLREAARAGVGDFLHLPLSPAELQDAVAQSAALATTTGARREGHAVSFFSAKGGVGTTTIAAHTGLHLAESSNARDIALCDARLQFGTAATVLGLEPDRDISDFVAELDHLGPVESYLTCETDSGLTVLAAPRRLADAERITPEDLSRVLIALRRRFACVLVDVPPVIDLLTLSALDVSERIVVVVDNVGPAIVESARALQLLADQGMSRDRIRVVINQPAPFPGGFETSAIAEELGYPVLESIAFETRSRTAVSRGDRIPTGSRAKTPFAKSIATIAAEVGPGGPGLATP